MSRKQKVFKICLSGQKNVGKTSIFNALRGLPFNKDPKAEINMYFHTVNVHGEDVKLQVWDTAGMEEYNSLTENYYRSAKGIIMVFSLASNESFSYMEKIVEDIKCCDYAPDARFFLVGNKTDLDTSIEFPQERVHGLLHDRPELFERFMKTSAKNEQGIKELFEAVAYTLVMAHTKPTQQQNLIAERYKHDNKSSCC